MNIIIYLECVRDDKCKDIGDGWTDSHCNKHRCVEKQDIAGNRIAEVTDEGKGIAFINWQYI